MQSEREKLVAIEQDVLKEAGFNLHLRAATQMPEDVKLALRDIFQREAKKLPRYVLGKIIENFEIAETAGPDQFKKAFIDMTEMAKNLDRIGQKLKRLDNIEQVLIFLIRFLKRSVIYQSINLVIALILFPIATHYINFIIPDLKVTPQNIWYFQKLGIILGGIAGIFLASITTPKN